ncbi:MAG: ABC transporter permease subunit, partial [Usitatibacter sp.]
IGMVAFMTRLTRNSVLEVMRQDYVRTARAKGLRDWVVITRYKPFILRQSIVEATEPVAPRPDWRIWTDSYNNLLQVFKW